MAPVGPIRTSAQSESALASIGGGRRRVKLLCWAQLVLAVFAITLGSACTGISASHERTVCTFGTGIWVGLCSLCCALLGFAAIQQSACQGKLLIGYFALCVVVALASIVLLGMSSMWIEKATKLYNADNQNYEMASVTLNVFLLVAAVCQTICTFLSAVLIAHYYWGWRCRSNDFASRISYVRAEEAQDAHPVPGQPRAHRYKQRNDPYYVASPPQQLATTAIGNRSFY